METEPNVILLVEDDQDHAEIVRRNLRSLGIMNPLMHVSDGQQALEYLYRRGPYSAPDTSPRPGLVLLDLRLPKVDGLEVLSTVKRDPDLEGIPVVILTTSNAESDITSAYGHGADSYLVKPMNTQQFSRLLESLGCYWLIYKRTDAT